MNIIFVLTLVVWLQKVDPSVAARLRENSNVLVPSNDVNLHEKIKTLLNGEEIDPEDFSDNEIESLSEANNAEIEKLRHKNLEKVVTKVFDDKNRNIEENLVDRDVEGFVLTPPPPPPPLIDREPPNRPTPASGFPRPPTPEWSTLHPEINATENASFSEYPTTLNLSENATTSSPPANHTHPELTTPNSTHVTTFSTDAPTNVWSTTPGTWESTTGSNTTNSSTMSTVWATSTQWSVETTQDLTSTEIYTTAAYNVTTPAYNETEPLRSPECIQYSADHSFSPDPSEDYDECLLGNTEKHIDWVASDGKLNSSIESVRILDISRNFIRFCENNSTTHQFENLTYLSAAYNNLIYLPNALLNHTADTLGYLSLAGNNFSEISRIGSSFIALPRLKELDLRNCKMTVLSSNLLVNLKSLRAIYLSYNHIRVIEPWPFPQSLAVIDLSNNTRGPLAIDQNAFWSLKVLKKLDLSFTQLDATSNAAFSNLTTSHLSLCYSQLSSTFNLGGSSSIEVLDISGNPLMSKEPSFFENFATNLESLNFKNSNVKSLSWTQCLTNLKIISLFDNNIHNITKVFSHMKDLEVLDLEKNSIGNWYDRLFHENSVLTVLNLRENKLTSLSNDMMEDMLHVESLGLGKNDFTCNCELEKFMHKLFEATKAEKFSDTSDDLSSESVEAESLDYELSDSTRPSFGGRNYLRPEYDVISRTYQKYYEMAELSHQALQNRSYYVDKRHPSNEFVLKSKAKAAPADSSAIRTILFDYDEEPGNYQCINVTSKEFLKIVEMHDDCMKDHTEKPEEESEGYKSNKESIFLTLSIALPLLMVLSVISVVAYWKWFYIKYFFVICKNSAILTFMDDSDGGSDAIVKKDDSIDVYLYDVFVSYCEQNREWVLDEFIPNIEKRESINVCLHERDFMVGCGILENIVSCMDRSRCLLLLVSENFLLSQWCQFEMNLAQHRLLETRRDKLIIVLLEDIPVNKQPKTLKYLMRTKTYIKWPATGSNNEKQLFWRRLKKAITTSKWENDSYGSIA